MSLQIQTSKNFKPPSSSDHDRALAEHKKSLKQQKISSVLIAVLVHAVILLGLALWIIVGPEPEPAEIQVRVNNTPEFKPVTKTETKVSTRKPSPPSSSSRLITSATTSEIFVPDVDTNAFEGIGIGDNLGVGLGMGGFGSGGGGSDAVFFNQKASAERVAFVIDYSLSMSGPRINLLKSELSQTMKLLSDGVKYQLIFFAGPAWTAGDEVKMAGRKSAVVKSGGRKFDWVSNGGATDWDTKGRRQKVKWLTKTPSALKKSLEAIETTPLVWGTDWEVPLEMALAMEPAPQIIFFMTDGNSGKDSMEIAKKIGRRAKSKSIPVNTISLMEPSTAAAMRELARRSKGKFTIVSRKGETTEEDFGD